VVDPTDDVREQKHRLQFKWNQYRTSHKEHKLYWAVLTTYRWEFGVAIFWNMVIATL